DGQVTLLQGGHTAINIDINTHFADGTPNPNVGRPFVSDSGAYGNNERVREREATRFTAFADYDFASNDDSLWRRIAGRHVLTGVLSTEPREDDNRSWMRYSTAPTYSSHLTGDGYLKFNDNFRNYNPVIYLGPSL